MTVLGRRLSLDALQWLGLLAAPLAWVAQFLVGYWLALSGCSAGGREWGVAVDAWTGVATAAAAVVALLGGTAALAAFRATRGARGAGGAEEDPPVGRIHFLATVGLTTTPLFLAIILMSGVGAIVLPDCRQA